MTDSRLQLNELQYHEDTVNSNQEVIQFLYKQFFSTPKAIYDFFHEKIPQDDYFLIAAKIGASKRTGSKNNVMQSIKTRLGEMGLNVNKLKEIGDEYTGV